ncbi:hypothetical protein BDW66DRAFT_136593 [Aspergillus desertorum]
MPESHACAILAGLFRSPRLGSPITSAIAWAGSSGALAGRRRRLFGDAYSGQTRAKPAGEGRRLSCRWLSWLSL